MSNTYGVDDEFVLKISCETRASILGSFEPNFRFICFNRIFLVSFLWDLFFVNRNWFEAIILWKVIPVIQCGQHIYAMTYESIMPNYQD